MSCVIKGVAEVGDRIYPRFVNVVKVLLYFNPDRGVDLDEMNRDTGVTTEHVNTPASVDRLSNKREGVDPVERAVPRIVALEAREGLSETA
jgi:hypothetical protein